MKTRKIAVLVSAMWVGVLWGQGPAATQDVPVRVEGRVMWLSGQTLVIAPDGSPSLNVDISQVPQDQHGRLREGERVVITGSVPTQRNRVIAASVERIER